MKWIAALLMIVNVVVYLWASGRQVDPVAVENSSSPDVNREGMLLLSEAGGTKQFGAIDNTQNTEQASTAAAAIDPNQPNVDGTTGLDDGSALIISEDLLEDANQEIAFSHAVEKQPVPNSSLGQCVRIGPFKKAEPWNNAQQWIAKQGVEYQPITSESRELRAVRVFLGPFSSKDALAQTRALLKEKNLDHFVYQVENGSTRVSLGYFTQEALANKFLSYLDSVKIEAKSHSEYRKLGPFNWMEIAAADISSDNLQNRDWGESAVKLAVSNCS